MDIDNFSNLLNKNWGVGQRLVFTSNSARNSSRSRSNGRQGGAIDAQGRAHTGCALSGAARDDAARADGRPAGRLPHHVQPRYTF